MIKLTDRIPNTARENPLPDGSYWFTEIGQFIWCNDLVHGRMLPDAYVGVWVPDGKKSLVIIVIGNDFRIKSFDLAL